MLNILSITLTLLTITSAKEENKWVWGGGSRNSKIPISFESRSEASARYEIYEPSNNNEFHNYVHGNRPLYPRPLKPSQELVQRPLGVNVQDSALNSGYRPAFFPESNRPIPGQGAHSNREEPYKEFEHCKCSERFNCESPGISYGHCDVGKKYCCYSKKPGGPFPSRPINSPENGVLVGPGGPKDPVPGVNYGFNGNRRPYPGTSGITGLAEFQRPGFGFEERPEIIGRPDEFIERLEGFIGRPEPNTYSPENGILVGPGGPIDRPYPGQYIKDFRSKNVANKKN